MSTSSKAIFTKRLYLCDVDKRQVCNCWHFQKDNSPVYTDTDKRTQQFIVTFIRGMATPTSDKDLESVGPIARLEIVWKKPYSRPTYSGLLAYDSYGKILFHAVEARINTGLHGNLTRTILQECAVPEKIITGAFADVLSGQEQGSQEQSYAVVISQEKLDTDGKPTGTITNSWQLGFADEALTALQKV